MKTKKLHGQSLFQIIFCAESLKFRNINRYGNSSEKYRLKTLSNFVQNFQWSENFVGFFAFFSVRNCPKNVRNR